MKRIAFLLLITVVAGCKEVGFHQLDVSSRNRASVQTARDLMQQLQDGLRQYYEEKHHYPVTTAAYLYDSIGRLVHQPIDATHLYRNDNGRGYFLAVGGRANRIVYSYPPTVGPGEYTLYWVGTNGVDENDEGDDVDAWTANSEKRTLERRRTVDLENDGQDDRLVLIRTGDEIAHDSMRFEIHRGKEVLFKDTWPLTVYFEKRPQLADPEMKRIVRLESDRFFDPSTLSTPDSLRAARIGTFVASESELRRLSSAKSLVFMYYQGDRGSKGVAWNPDRKQFSIVWKS